MRAWSCCKSLLLVLALPSVHVPVLTLTLTLALASSPLTPPRACTRPSHSCARAGLPPVAVAAVAAAHACCSPLLHTLPRTLAYLFRVRPSRRPLTASTDSSAPCAFVEPPLPAPVIGRCCAAAFPLPQKKKKLESVLPPPGSRPLSHTALAQRLCSWT